MAKAGDHFVRVSSQEKGATGSYTIETTAINSTPTLINPVSTDRLSAVGNEILAADYIADVTDK